MIALDTIMLVRALVAEHPDQLAVVRQLIAGDTLGGFKSEVQQADDDA